MSAKARLRRIGRLFVIKTRFEAWIVTYAIALGAIERGRYYLDFYPGAFGWVLAAACTGVVFLAGAKLLDSVQPAPATVQIGPHSARVKRRSRPIRSRSRALRPAPVHYHGLHFAQIDAAPHDRADALKAGAGVERALRVAELEKRAPTGARRAAERSPVAAAEAE
jgi:hypothetical protein